MSAFETSFNRLFIDVDLLPSFSFSYVFMKFDISASQLEYFSCIHIKETVTGHVHI